MTDTIYMRKNKTEDFKVSLGKHYCKYLRLGIAFFQAVLLKPTRLSKKDIIERMPKELAPYVNHYIGTLAGKEIFYDKTIILKEDDVKNLDSRINEILKFEDEKRVIFGIFSTSIKPKTITKLFRDKAKFWIRDAGKAKDNNKGQIWTVEVNGKCKGCGVIGEDTKIKIWRDI